ncbi:hypothetical protein [Bacillus sp. FJAT-45350]|uniref:hypothetical protein n=1 Tax=Bacillus sp. FJAT-45350 TaxID=2011014 RepID=UPI000BB7060C|nr:hypothetical protein [Bacillus sp. FJAT-45350]
MILQKGFIAIGIFFVIFATAWWIHGLNDRNLYMQNLDESETIQILEAEPHQIRFEPFRPREYIRIHP